ncbi:MAG: hypothetical protein IJE90_00145 [Clostridia bacterium]|nr:hypothetical protein [Clostridia bacterium]
MKDHSARGAGVILLLVFAAFLVFNIYSSLNEKINYIEATLVTVEEYVSLDAVFIRDQIVITGNSDNIEYLVSNGEKVAANQAVCIYFKTDEARDNYKKLVEIENEIEAIKAVDAMITSSNDSVKLDELVYTLLNQILSDTEAGKITQANDTYTSIRQVIIARDAGLYSKDIFRERLSELESQRTYYDSLVDKNSDTVVSPCSGYFFSSADGFESVLNTDCFDDLSDEYFDKTYAASDPSENVIGTVVNSFYWYLAAELDDEHLYDFRGKEQLRAYFPELLASYNDFEVENIIKSESGKHYLVLKTSVMIPEYLNTRFQPVDIVLNSYTGVKVPIEALHQKEGKWGVFCLEGASAKFKSAEIIYQTDSYYLLEMAESSSKGLYIYDKIIISGKDFKIK